MPGMFGLVTNSVPTVKSINSELNTGSFAIYQKYRLDGSIEAVFHVNLIEILDRAFCLDGLRMLSIEQERYLTKYIKQGGVVTNALNSNSDDPYGSLDEIFKQLDSFLGGYIGEDNGKYAR